MKKQKNLFKLNTYAIAKRLDYKNAFNAIGMLIFFMGIYAIGGGLIKLIEVIL